MGNRRVGSRIFPRLVHPRAIAAALVFDAQFGTNMQNGMVSRYRRVTDLNVVGPTVTPESHGSLSRQTMHLGVLSANVHDDFERSHVIGGFRSHDLFPSFVHSACVIAPAR